MRKKNYKGRCEKQSLEKFTSFPGNYVSHERHVDNLLKVVSKNKVYLLLIYFEKDGQPTWEMYYKGRFIRQQSTVYTYEGYLYDKKKMVRIYELSKGTETDIGLLLQGRYLSCNSGNMEYNG